MATDRLPMRHIREILRLKWGLKRSHRETARSLGISAGAVAWGASGLTGVGLEAGTRESESAGALISPLPRVREMSAS
jgi:hypothetical protein